VAGLVLAGCGGAASSASAVPASSASPGGCQVARQITVTGSKVSPPPSTLDVKAGCEVKLTVTADRTSEVHVHVVDLEKPITAGQPVTIDFTPTQQGVYEVELHDPDLLLVKLAVR
jgi:plastocyanin